jgi:hypothetical protein
MSERQTLRYISGGFVMSCNNSSGICAFGNSWWWIIVLVIIFVLWNGNSNGCGCGCDNGCC